MGRVFSLHFEGKIPFRFGEVIDFCYLCTYLYVEPKRTLMLVATMSSSEVFDTLEKDLERVAVFTAHKEKVLMKELRKSRLEMVSQSYDCHAPNADYIIIVHCNRKGYVSRLRFAFIKETLEYVSVAS